MERHRILEIGCGTGRIGSQFTAAGDNYLGVDLSLGMLREFQQKRPRAGDQRWYARTDVFCRLATGPFAPC